jgi:hypothetical protein
MFRLALWMISEIESVDALLDDFIQAHELLSLAPRLNTILFLRRTRNAEIWFGGL